VTPLKGWVVRSWEGSYLCPRKTGAMIVFGSPEEAYKAASHAIDGTYDVLYVELIVHEDDEDDEITWH
jgi:hypothetical protein